MVGVGEKNSKFLPEEAKEKKRKLLESASKSLKQIKNDYLPQEDDYIREAEQYQILLQIQESSSKLNDLTFVFTKQYYNTMLPKNKNLVFSPLSIQVVLGLIASGCKIGAEQDKILSFLKHDSLDVLNNLFSYLVRNVLAGSSSNKLSLNFVNGIWIDQSFLNLKQSFVKVVHDVYNAALSQVDFKNKHEEARKKVNKWAKKETRSLIEQILPDGSVDKSTRVVFGNALYFKGAWKKKFDASMTKKHNFYLLDGGSVNIPFMTSYKKKQRIGVYNGFKVLQLKYKVDDIERGFSMCIFLPDAKDGLSLMVNKLTSQPGFVNNYLPYSKVIAGEFRIPKFKIAFEFQASDFLKGLGLDLPLMTEIVDGETIEDDLIAQGIFHKAFIEVNEEGTEAAAVTIMTGIGAGRAPVVKKIDFVADHPFVFLIREDKTGVVMFIGTLINPCVSSS